jgi:hypothetical protein
VKLIQTVSAASAFQILNPQSRKQSAAVHPERRLKYPDGLGTGEYFWGIISDFENISLTFSRAEGVLFSPFVFAW